MDRVTSWREAAAAGEQMTLPSGNVVVLRRVHLMDLVEQGRVPDTLSAMVMEVMDSGLKKPKLDDLAHYVELVNAVCLAAFVDPPLAAEASEDALGVQEVSFTDRAAVFAWANEAGRKLRPFRHEPAGAVEAL